MNSIFADLHRFTITALLTKYGSSDFVSLKKQLNYTDGNLSFHLKKLQQENIITLTKTFEHNKPKTYVMIAPHGHTLFQQHLQVLESIIKETRDL